MTVNEGSTTTFSLTYNGNPMSIWCYFKDVPPRLTIYHIIDEVVTETKQSTPFPLTNVNNPGIRIGAGNDNNCDNEEYDLNLFCEDGGGSEVPLNCEDIRVQVPDNNPGACRDPHLTQKVRGIDEDGNVVVKNICYDLYGNAGDQFELITDNILKTRLTFELRDDFYIGKVFYETRYGFFNITTRSLRSRNEIINWGAEDTYIIGDIENYPFASVEQTHYATSIAYVDEDRSQVISISKVKQEYGKSYLNVMVDKSQSIDGVLDPHHGGLFGYIASQDFEFFEPIQGSDATVFKVNGRFIKVFVKFSPDQKEQCYSMSLEDIIYPKNVYYFQKSL